MTERHPESSEGNGSAVPRDLPDQHARPGDDPLDVDIEELELPGESDDSDGSDDGSDQRSDGSEDDSDASGGRSDGDPDESVAPDEAGAGLRGKPQTGGVHPEQPVPDEPSG